MGRDHRNLLLIHRRYWSIPLHNSLSIILFLRVIEAHLDLSTLFSCNLMHLKTMITIWFQVETVAGGFLAGSHRHWHELIDCNWSRLITDQFPTISLREVWQVNFLGRLKWPAGGRWILYRLGAINWSVRAYTALAGRIVKAAFRRWLSRATGLFYYLQVVRGAAVLHVVVNGADVLAHLLFLRMATLHALVHIVLATVL